MLIAGKLRVQPVVMVPEGEQLRHHIVGKTKPIRTVGKYQVIEQPDAIDRPPDAIQLHRHTLVPGGKIDRKPFRGTGKCLGNLRKFAGRFSGFDDLLPSCKWCYST